MYPFLIFLFIAIVLIALALLSDIQVSFPTCKDRMKAAFARLRDLVWTPPFLQHWQFMRPFFSLTVAKLFITWFAVVPIAAHLLSKLPDTVKLPQSCNWTVDLGSTTQPNDAPIIAPQKSGIVQSHCSFLEFPIELPFNWQLLWFASLLYFLAFAIYWIACPGFIKRYPDYTAYRSTGHAIRWIVWEFHYMETDKDASEPVRNVVEQRLIAKRYAEPTDEGPTPKPIVAAENTYVVFRHGDENYRFGSPSDGDNARQSDWEKDVFWEVLGGWAKSRPLFATTIRILTRTAAAITLYIVCENIWVAMRYISHSL